MAGLAVQEAVRARLKEHFTAARVFYEGEVQAPKDGSPYIVLQFPYNRSRQVTMGAPGDNWVRENGGIRFVLNVRRRGGTEPGGIADGRRWADEIARMFRMVRFDGIRTFAPSAPVTDDSTDAIGGYYVLTFVVEYEADIRA